MKNKQKKKARPVKAAAETTYTISESSDLLPFLLKSLNKLSRNAVKSILTRGQVRVNNQTVTKHNYILHPGDTVMIRDNKTAMKTTALTGITIIHEDDDIIVIEKAAGILSVATQIKDGESTAYAQLTAYVRQDHPRNRIFIVHRLDRDTSGIMVFAKNEQTKERLQQQWKHLVIERMYTAVVEGNVGKPAGTITSWLTESKTFKIHSCPFDNGGKKAVTHYKKIQGNHAYSLLQVHLETGRKNQIRVHMQDIGHPIAGDKKYGAHTNPLKRLGLHATTLVLLHPSTNKRMAFSAAVPKKFSAISKSAV